MRDGERIDRLWVWAAVLCGAALRLGALPQLALEHYDEGVYASNLLILESEGGEFPGRPLFAPPLWPIVIEWSTIVWHMAAGSSPHWLPMLPGILCGIALIPSVAWVMRRGFGPTAGIAAAWLIALSEYHAFYCRTALTDAPLMLAWLWAVAGIGMAIERRDSRSAMVAGVITAIGWWTKYNGWLPLAIGFSGGVAYQLMQPKDQRSWTRLARTLGLILGTAIALWLPVLWDCQSVGGYSAVAANHRGYVEPWSKWFPTLLHQGANLDHYAGWLTGLSAVTAIVAGARHCRGEGFSLSSRVLIGLGVMLATGVSLTIAVGLTFGVILTGSFAAIVGGLLRWRRGELSPREMLAACLLSSWLMGLLLATPRYHAYPRLVMPLWLAGCLGAAWLLAQLAAQIARSDVPPSKQHVGALVPPVAISILALSAMFAGGTKIWEDRTSLVKVSEEISQWLSAEHREKSPPVVFVYGEPALFAHLRQRGVAAVLRGDLGFAVAPPAAPTYQIAGLFSQRDTAFQREWELVGDRFIAVKSWTVRPSSLVLLDNLSPAELRARPQESERNLTLHRLTSQ